MILAEQSAILVEAIEQELLRREDIVRWADEIIVAMERPPSWIIDLSTLNSPYLVDFARLLRIHSVVSLPLHRRVQIVVLAYLAGVISFSETLPKLFRAVIYERRGAERDPLDERLADTLVCWDHQENLDVIEPPLRARFEALFREYLTDIQEVAAVLPWRSKM
ncbi:MAG: hypothetical protein M9920_05890 [Verrucomicrobiae bacterium]|nr:hypothetical protein [Verrucomicrobiae bacterium]